MRANRSHCSLKKSNVSDCDCDSLFHSHKNELFAKKSFFLPCFWQFFTAFPLLYPRVNCSRRSSLHHSFFKTTGAIRSCRSLQKCNGSDLLFSKSALLFCSFTYKNLQFVQKTKEWIPNPAFQFIFGTLFCLEILPLEEEDKVLVFGETFGNFSISGFEMVLTRYVSTYIITYYLPSGNITGYVSTYIITYYLPSGNITRYVRPHTVHHNKLPSFR